VEKDMLGLVVSSGTGKAAQVGDEFIWGKTGTTENYGDAWFVGGNDDITVAIWVGYADKLQPMEYEHGGPVAGGTFPAEIFHDFMSSWLELRQQRRLERGANKRDDTTEGVAPAVPIAPSDLPPAEQAEPTEPDTGGPAEGGDDSGDDAAPDAAPAAETTTEAETQAEETEKASGDDSGGEQRKGKPGTEIKIADSQFGSILFDSDDQVIYLFDKEKSERSECFGECAEAWPPVLTEGDPQAGGGANAGLLGTIERDDGTTQVTYNGHPLYYWVNDPAGQVLCNGVDEFGGVWLAVEPNGDAVQ
jgi:predicted lipoprotein with Yx(FWY)xxD motif